jgi:hypothetical protein
MRGEKAKASEFGGVYADLAWTNPITCMTGIQVSRESISKMRQII